MKQIVQKQDNRAVYGASRRFLRTLNDSSDRKENLVKQRWDHTQPFKRLQRY